MKKQQMEEENLYRQKMSKTKVAMPTVHES